MLPLQYGCVRQTFSALAVAVIAFTASHAQAAIVDGKVTVADGYTEQYSVSWTLTGMMGENLGTVSGGKLWQKRDGDGALINFAVMLPPSFVNHRYGDNTVDTYGGMGGGSHTFGDLLGSDQTTFQVLDADDNLLVEFKADYIAEITTGGMGGTTSYKSAGVLDKDESHPTGGVITDKADGEKVTAASLLAMQVPKVATSLEHNLALYGLSAGPTITLDLTAHSPPVLVDGDNEPILDIFGKYQTTGPDALFWADWEFALIYEVQLDPSKFPGTAPTTFNALPSDGHASPAKLAGSLTDPDPEPDDKPSPDVPEPTGLAMLGLGGLLLFASNRPRHRLL